MSGMCHLVDELFYARKGDGSVRLLQLLPGTVGPGFIPDIDTHYPDAVWDKTLTEDQWITLFSGCLSHWDHSALRDTLRTIFGGDKLSDEVVERYNAEEGA